MSTRGSRLHSVGQHYHQFELINIVGIPELQCVLRELIHTPTGARVMQLENSDPENLFCLSFQTLPYNSNGVAHILEHTVLCGSEKFPIKDPFFAMGRRSLNTFMNALTGADFTCYPASSQVPKDLYNLLEVYLDAVFHPNLKELSFSQEGHRLEFSQPTDPSTPLEYKGIVYNEMKGSLSSATARLSEAIHSALFPNVTYGFNSGGDPKCIPDLTYEELKRFYHTFYNPSRCLFFFYGNLPLEEHLDFIAKHTLNQAQKGSPLPPIPLQPRFSSPIYLELTYPIAPEEDLKDKTYIAFGWLTCHILEQQDVLALNILQIILMDTDASPLKKALLQSGLCKQANPFIDIELNEIPWGVVLKGCQKAHAVILEELLFTTLKNLCQTGIPLELIENAIHQLEFFRSEITGDQAPFGLSLFMRSALLKQHGADPTEGLMIHSLFDRLRQAILANPHYFSELIQKYLLNNPHFVRIVMEPDPQLGVKELEEEKQRLAQIKASLSTEQIEEIVNKSLQLAAFQKQQEEEDIEILPKVSITDIPLKGRDYPLIQEEVGNLTVFHHNVFTNDIVYADLVFGLPDLTESDLTYLRLFTVVLSQVGCKGRSYLENLDYIQGNTGGIGAGISLNIQAQNHHQIFPTFHLRGKALHRKAAKLFPLLHEMISTARVDDLKRLKEILFKHFTGMESRLTQSSLKYAINLSASGLGIPSKIANDLYGINYYWAVKEMVKNYDHQGTHILAKLQEIQKKVTCVNHPHLIVSCHSAMYDELKRHGFYGLKDLETSPYQPWRGNFPLEPVPSQGRIIASSVAYIGKVFPTLSYVHPLAPALNIASFLFDNISLHTAIREKGGAYGGGAVNNSLAGNFYFYSYRDPNIVSTLQAFKDAVEQIAKGDFDGRDLEEAKFEMIQSLDSPLSPGSQAEVAYGWRREGRTPEIRQAFRNKILALTHQEVIEAVHQIILKQMDGGADVVFAGKEQLEKANQVLIAKSLPPLEILT